MDGRFNNPFIGEEEEAKFLQENCTSSPTLSSSPSPPFSNSNNHMLINDHYRNHHHIHNHKYHQKALSVNMASPKKSRRAIQKRVVSIPIGEIDGSTRTNNSGGEGAPPSDSWAWRKYGQKPIKGSPYPRGYYRCSSSKGCPARKQVERSRVDPTMLVITYACEHNHPWPASRNNNSSSNTSSPPATTKPITTRAKSTNTATKTTADAVAQGDGVDIDTKPKIKKEELVVFGSQQELIEDTFNDLGGEEHSMIINSTTDNDFGWFTDDVVSTSHAILESPICAGISSSNLNNISGGESGVSPDEMAMIFPMREEDESLFADLGELPECSVVFRRSGFFEQEEERRRCNLRTAPWCGSTG